MSYEEAIRWLRGELSMTDMIWDNMRERPGEASALIASADAAKTQQAYYIVKARAEGILTQQKLEKK